MTTSRRSLRPAILAWVAGALIWGLYELTALAAGLPLLSHAAWSLADSAGAMGGLVVGLPLGMLLGHFFWSRRVKLRPGDELTIYRGPTAPRLRGFIEHTTQTNRTHIQIHFRYSWEESTS